MTCKVRTLVGRGMVISKGSSTNTNFCPLTEWIPSVDVRSARAAIEMRADTGSCQIAPGYQIADDPDTPGSAFQLGALGFRAANGIQYPSTLTDITADVDTKLFVRFGVLVKQDANGAPQGCMASIRVDVVGP